MSHLYHYVLTVNQIISWPPSLQHHLPSQHTPLYYYRGALFSNLNYSQLFPISLSLRFLLYHILLWRVLYVLFLNRIFASLPPGWRW